MRLSIQLAVLLAADVAAAPLPCAPMQEYVPPEVIKTYDMEKHNGTWYEAAFRDMYPAAGAAGCYCQQSIKYVHKDRGFIDDYFVFTCGPEMPVLNYISPVSDLLACQDRPSLTHYLRSKSRI